MNTAARIVDVAGLGVSLSPNEVLVVYEDGSWTRDNRNATSMQDPSRDAREWFKITFGHAVRVEYGTGEVFTNHSGVAR
jgi:hypothetical protein